MPKFPKGKPEKDALYSSVIAGITANPGDYPSGAGQPFALTTMNALNTAKNTARNTRLNLEGQLAVAVTAENGAYAGEDAETRRLINLAIATHGINSLKLTLIGWGPLGQSQSQVAGQPRNLKAVLQGPGSLLLDWKAPAPAQGHGSVRFYRVERLMRTLAGQQIEDWGAWQVSATASKVSLSGLGRGVEYEFRVIAVNAAGDSVPSNTVTVVL